MSRFTNSRLRTPLITLVLGTALAVAMGVTVGWQPFAFGEAVIVAASVGYYLYGGKDTDMGAIIGARKLDERQRLRRLKVQALVGRVLSLACAISLTAAIAAKATYWPFEVLVIVMGVTFFAGWAYYREGA